MSPYGDGLWIEYVDAAEWARADELSSLIFRVLYADFGVAVDSAWRELEPGSVTAVALAGDGRLMGTARLLPAAGDSERQIRQLAVAPTFVGRGVGSALMAALEVRARDEGATAIRLNARYTAIGYYVHGGYVAAGDTFVSGLTGILHHGMHKTL